MSNSILYYPTIEFRHEDYNGSGMQLFLRIKYIELCPLDMN